MSFQGLTKSDTKFLSGLEERLISKKANKKSGDRRRTEPCEVEKILITSAKNPGMVLI